MSRLIGNSPRISTVDALTFGRGYLKTKGIDSYVIDADVLLRYALGCDRTQMLSDARPYLSGKEYNSYTKMLKTRAKRIPVAYITGEREFFSLPFYVDESVLIPRPDTEILVEEVLYAVRSQNTLDKGKKQCKILEIGTGSGCISIAIAKNGKNVEVCATDISPEALETAKKNAILNGVEGKIKFIQSDLFENVKDTGFDIIISNPPYIPEEDIPSLMPDVRLFEPIIALNGGREGLDFYKKITPSAKKYVSNPQGLIFYEIGHNQAGQVQGILKDNGCSPKKITLKKDYSGNNRVIYAALAYGESGGNN